MAVEQVGIVPAMIVSFEFQELGAPGVSACQAQGQHGRLASRVGEADSLGIGYHAQENFGGFGFGGCSRGKMRSLGNGLGYNLNDPGMRMPLDQGAE